MKLVFASDIHGSAYYCEKLLQAYAREGADKLFLLGDLLYHGPRNALPRDYAPARVAEMLNANRAHILCVRGIRWCWISPFWRITRWPTSAGAWRI